MQIKILKPQQTHIYLETHKYTYMYTHTFGGICHRMQGCHRGWRWKTSMQNVWARPRSNFRARCVCQRQCPGVALAYIPICTHIYTRIHMLLHIYTYTYVYMYTCTHLHIYTYTHIYTYKFADIRARTYTCAHTHTHI